jgi:hypothetical protein
MKNFSLLIALVALPAIAQTKLISHKSHSGSRATFGTALENNLFDIGDSNFGNPRQEYSIDSIILIEDNKAVVVSSLKIFAQEDVIQYKPGRDTLKDHPLLSRKHAKDSIEKVLNPYGGAKIKLINYDNEKVQKNSIPVVPHGDSGTPNMPLILVALALISLLLGFAFYMLHKLKTIRLA